MTAVAAEPTANPHILAAVHELAGARSAVQLAADALAMERAKFDETHAAKIAFLADARLACETSEQVVRELVEAHYRATGEKAPTAGVSVVMSKSYEVTDEAAALAWAKASGTGLIPESVDKKVLQKIAAASPLPFVAITETPSVRIATDLAKALGGGA